MRYIEADDTKAIKNVKYFDEGSNLRFTFDWARGVSQVYISTTPSPLVGKLFTLQEYRKQAGFITPKAQGETTYYIHASLRENGEDVVFTQPSGNQIVYTYKTIIDYYICEKMGKFKNHQITFSTNNHVPCGVICYVKKENEYPSNICDGEIYNFNETLKSQQPITRIVRTTKNEYIRLFLCEKEEKKLYKLNQLNQQRGVENGTV